MRTLNPYFLDKLTEAANEIARAGYRATIEDNALITDCRDRKRITQAFVRARIGYWRECNRHGLSWKYQF